MNRLILIGNGFDLAHGMKTSYNDFILWYLKKCFEEANNKSSYKDDLIQLTKRHSNWPEYLNNVSELVDHFYNDNLIGIFTDDKVYVKRNYTSYVFQNLFVGTIKFSFLKLLLTKCKNYNWVDIENEFYEQLKSILQSENKAIPTLERERKKNSNLDDLNQSLKCIISELEMYLKDLKPSGLNNEYSRIFSSPIRSQEICTVNLNTDVKVKKSLILNFNYTTTPEKYFDNKLTNTEINYIHGKAGILNYPLIFGFGDELDSDYSKMELQKTNKYLTYIKSFWYFKTSNYHNLVRFIEDDEFQVYVLGHSCGLSDRTMLNMIFEHENCKSIKIFYHGTKEKNNFTNLTQEISRHFKDKGMMRKKIVPFDKSEPMPQVKPQ